MEVKIFVKTGCANCGKAYTLKEELERLKVKVRLYDVFTREGWQEATFYSVRKTPSVVLERSDGWVVFMWDGKVPTAEEVLSMGR